MAWERSSLLAYFESICKHSIVLDLPAAAAAAAAATAAAAAATAAAAAARIRPC